MINISVDAVRYRTKVALHKTTLSLPDGVCALIGANGAGKTTLMTSLVGLKGRRADIVDNDAPIARHDIGWLPQEHGFPPAMKVEAMLHYAGWLKGIKDDADRQRRVDQAISDFGLDEWRTHRISQLSGGTKHRVGAASVTLSGPRLLLLDEPTAGLDPLECARLHESILRMANDRVIMISSHLIEDIETMANWIVVLNKGHKVYEGAATDIDRPNGSFRDGVLQLMSVAHD